MSKKIYNLIENTYDKYILEQVNIKIPVYIKHKYDSLIALKCLK